MNDRSDEAHSVAFGVMVVPLLLVVAVVLAIAFKTTREDKGAAATSMPQGATAPTGAAIPAPTDAAVPTPAGAVVPAPTGAAVPAPTGAAAAAVAVVEHIHFDAEVAVLPYEALPVLARVAERARADGALTVRIAPRHAAGADELRGFAVALDRGQAVRHALEAHGVTAAQLRLDDPLRADTAADPRAGQRVELHLE